MKLGRSILVAVLTALSMPVQASDLVERGQHLATVMGCTSCHGHDLSGHLFQEDARMAIAWSTNLSRLLPTWSDAQVETTLRTGRRPDGSALWFMPTFSQQQLTPDDMRALVAWLRSVPPAGEAHPPIRRGPQFESAIAQGYRDSAAQAEHVAARRPPELGTGLQRGRYLAILACAECHGPDLKGARDPHPGDPPDLAIAAAYSAAEFAALLKTGVTRAGRPAAEMSTEAPKRLSVLGADEVDAIHRYLKARASR